MTSPSLHRYFLGFLALGMLGVWGCAKEGAVQRQAESIYLHHVEPGETLEDIADEYYGDPSRAGFIKDFNGIDAGDLRTGVIVRVPLGAEDEQRLRVRKKARAPYNEGLELAQNGSYLDAIKKFQTSLDVDPDFIEARYNLGVTFQKIKAYDRALEQFERVTQSRRDRPDYYFALGNCLFHMNRYRDAAAAFERVTSLDRFHTKAQYSLAVCYEKMGNRNKARDAWERYLSLDNKSVWASEARKRLDNLK